MLDELHHVLMDAERRATYDDPEHPMGLTVRHDLHYYAFPQTWGDTSLGFGGMAGQMVTTATTHIVTTDYDAAFVYFGGRFAYEATERDARQWMRDLRCPSVRNRRVPTKEDNDA